jgi:hypothetical protein
VVAFLAIENPSDMDLCSYLCPLYYMVDGIAKDGAKNELYYPCSALWDAIFTHLLAALCSRLNGCN